MSPVDSNGVLHWKMGMKSAIKFCLWFYDGHKRIRRPKRES